jgi:CRISPR-associated protein (TIGR02584 family)
MPNYRNILVITLGFAPAIVTETVFSLLKPEPDSLEPTPARWVPHEIHIVTTVKGRTDSKVVVDGEESQLAALFRQFGEEYVQPKFLVPKIKATGVEVQDIRNRDENVAYANGLSTLIEALARPAQHRLHVSMAGGRKTMGSYAHAALSLFGRAQDELSHVLVEPSDFENCTDFYWPSQSQEIRSKPLNASDARIYMVKSPFVPLGNYLRRRPFPKGDIDYARMIEHAKAALGLEDVRLDANLRTVSIGDSTMELGDQEFAFFRVLATARKEGWAGYGPGGSGHNQGGWVAYKQFLDLNSQVYKKFFEYWAECYPTVNNEVYETFKAALDALLVELENASPERKKAVRKAAQDMFKSIKKRVTEIVEKGLGASDVAKQVVPQIVHYKIGDNDKGWAVGIEAEPTAITIVPVSRGGRS